MAMYDPEEDEEVRQENAFDEATEDHVFDSETDANDYDMVQHDEEIR
jgi:hypothetical protein